MRKVLFGKSNSLAGIAQLSGVSLDKLQSRYKTGAVGDLHVESRPRVEFEEQRPPCFHRAQNPLPDNPSRSSPSSARPAKAAYSKEGFPSR
jgi:hypothetical protein